jgi:hypothetical protein
MDTGDRGLCEYEFVFILGGIPELSDDVANALFESGCDDATLSSRSGRIYLTFAREETSFQRAILTAIRDVRRAGIGAEVLAVDNSNLVTPSEIARRIGRSRQMIAQYINGSRGPGGFPPPSCHLTEGHHLWNWSDVSAWLFENGVIDRQMVQVAADIAIINSVLEMVHHRKLNPALSRDVLEFATSD